jgi:hypothetical protein
VLRPGALAWLRAQAILGARAALLAVDFVAPLAFLVLLPDQTIHLTALLVDSGSAA